MKHPPHPVSLLATFLSRPNDVGLALHLGAVLESAGLDEEAVAVWSLGDDVNPNLRKVKDHPGAKSDVRKNSAAADAAMRRHFTLLHARAIDNFEARTGRRVERVRAAIWPLTHDRPFDYREDMHRPAIFYMPDLPASPVVPTELLAWACDLESATPAIRREYEQARSDNVTGEPYVPASAAGEQWANLRGTLDWAAIHLYKYGAATDFASHFPHTTSALAGANLVRIDGVPMEVFFSRLTPKAHIPPHYGLTNTRLTVHLPIIVPDGGGIRVGPQTLDWKEGEIIAFDDSYEHEAWNGPYTDRVVLIFEVHHPDLTEDERAAIEETYSVRQDWLNQRMNMLTRSLDRMRRGGR